MNCRNLRDPLSRFEIVVHACVHAGVAEMSVERAFIVEGLHQPSQVAQICAQSLGSHGGILKSFPTQRLAGNVRSHAEARFAYIPYAPCLSRVSKQAHVGRSRGAVERTHQASRLRLGFIGGVGAKLDHQPARSFWQEREAVKIYAFAPARVDHDVVEAFKANRTMFHDQRHLIGTDIYVAPSDNQQHASRADFRPDGMSPQES